MARSVSLSDEAFRTLRAEKGPSESDSDVLLRLAAEARRRRKDPVAFFHHPPKAAWTQDEYAAFAARMRAADQERAGQALKDADAGV